MGAGSKIGARFDSWWNRGRITAYLRVLLVLQAAGAVTWLILSPHLIDRLGKPIGTDFLSFWAAGRLALAGTPALAYDLPAHLAAEHALPGYAGPYYAFFYPPLFLPVCALLAWAPYGVALAAWLAATGLACWAVIRRLAQDRGAWLPFLAFPALWITLGHGQNALLTTALFGLAMIQWDRRPFLAGLACGLLAFKPQLGVLLPLAMLAGRRWTALLGAVLGTTILAALTTALFGPAIWPAFLAQSDTARTALEMGAIGADKMVSVFAAVQLLHGGARLAWAAQIVIGLAAALPVAQLHWRNRGSAEARMAATITGTLLATPFLLDYDLMLLALPLTWQLRQATTQRLSAAEKLLLSGAYLLPLIARPLAEALVLPIAPVVIGGLHWLSLRSANRPLNRLDNRHPLIC